MKETLRTVQAHSRCAYSVTDDLNCAPAPSCALLAGLSMEEVREYERTMQEKTNDKVKSSQSAGEAADD